MKLPAKLLKLALILGVMAGFVLWVWHLQNIQFRIIETTETAKNQQLYREIEQSSQTPKQTQTNN